MDCAKIGRLITRLRKEKGLTQQNMADALNISHKTVSKWECGLGCPDVSLWPELAAMLGVEITQMLEGEIVPNRPDSGNMGKVRFYECPTCHNALFSTGSASVFCCGRKLEPLAPGNSEHKPTLQAEVMDVDYFITIDHPMEREHYLLFAAYVKSDRVFFTRLYPEQSAEVRMPHMPGGKLYLYCTQHGFEEYTIR